MKKIIFVGVFLMLSAHVSSQIKTIGLPYIKGYDRYDYSAGTQSWQIAQDTNGIMYFANNDGLLQFDGELWRTYTLENQSVVRSVCVSSKGRVYFSGFNEFGYLEMDPNGSMSFQSLRHLLPELDQSIGEVWRIHEVPEGIIFQSFKYILLYSDNQLEVLAKAEEFGFSFFVDDRFFIQDKDRGLMELRGRRLFLLPNGNVFKGETEVWSMLDYGDGDIMIGTQQHGLYLFDGYSINTVNSDASDILTEKQIFSSRKIDDKLFAYGTIQDGLFVFNKDGKVVQHINKDRGLLNNTVLNIFQDRNKQLWLALDNGINYVELFSPFTFINAGMGIEGAGYDAAIFEGNLYLATNQGLFVKKYLSGTQEPFKLIKRIKGQVWTLSEYNDVLLVSHNRGAFSIKNGNIRHIEKNEGVWRFLPVVGEPDLLIAGTYSSLDVYEFKNKQWQKRNTLQNFEESSRVMEMDENGDIWVSHGYKGVYRITVNDDYTMVTDISFFDSNNGLPSDFDNYVYKLNGEIIFGTSKGIYHFDSVKEKFVAYDKWQRHFGENHNIRFPVLDHNENIYYSDNEYPYLLKKTAKGYQKLDTVFTKLGDFLVGGFEKIIPIDSNNIILCSKNGFVHYDSDFHFPDYKPFKTLIREIVSTSEVDTTIYFGNLVNPGSVPELNFKRNDLLFKFSATIYGRRAGIRYKTYLEGYDDEWSGYQSKNIKEYTNLGPGDYVFKVKAQDKENHEVVLDTFSFIILPPWYRSVLAHVIYGILIVIAIVLASRYLNRRMKDEKDKLRKKQKEEIRQKEEKFRQENLLAEQKIIKLKNEKLRAEVEKKRTDMELKNKEVVSIAMQITHKNELMSEIKRKLLDVAEKVNEHAQGEIKNLVRTIDSDVKLDNDWDRFQKHFEDVHSDFFKSLRNKYPELTPKDLRMCAYLRMNLSTKEIAMISNISVRGAEISRYRLRKKLGLDKDQNLVDYMMSIS